jgi:hypothetical protein
MYAIPSATKDFRKLSFFVNTVKNWNNLPPDIGQFDLGSTLFGADLTCYLIDNDLLHRALEVPFSLRQV